MDLVPLYRRVPASFWRFALIGVGGLLVDIATLYLCIRGFGVDRYLARIPSYVAAATFTWAMNRWLTFGPSGRPLLVEWLGFLVTNLGGQAVNMAVYSLVLLVLPVAPWVPAVGAGAGSMAGLVLNYTASRLMVFRKVVR